MNIDNYYMKEHLGYEITCPLYGGFTGIYIKNIL